MSEVKLVSLGVSNVWSRRKSLEGKHWSGQRVTGCVDIDGVPHRYLAVSKVVRLPDVYRRIVPALLEGVVNSGLVPEDLRELFEECSVLESKGRRADGNTYEEE